VKKKIKSHKAQKTIELDSAQALQTTLGVGTKETMKNQRIKID
jgi:hypothetical protein